MRIETMRSNLQRSQLSKSNMAQEQSSVQSRGREQNARRTRDVLVLEPVKQKSNKGGSVLEHLMERKQQLTERKSSLIESASAEGGSMGAISDQLKEIDKQMADIDAQITETMLEAQRESMGLGDEETDKKTEDGSQPKTEEEAQAEQVATLTKFSTDVSQMEVLSSSKTKAEGEARVLRMEISLDESRSLSGQVATAKREQLGKVEAAIERNWEQIGEQLHSINDEQAALVEGATKVEPSEVEPSEAEPSKMATATQPNEANISEKDAEASR